MLVSIIMPIYNSQYYIAEAIESIINQSYTNWELLLIDDRSTDNSYQIAQKFQSIDSRIKVYKNKENLGICGNRNKGIEYANGEYITFIDDDDIYQKNLLQDNIDLLMKYKADFIKFGRELVDVDKNDKIIRKEKTNFLNTEVVVINNESKFDMYSHFKKPRTLMNVWNGIYSKNIIDTENIKFDETMHFGSEDADFSYNFYLNSNTGILNPNTYYKHYRRDLSSTSRKFNFNKIDSLIKTASREAKVWKFLSENEMKEVNKYKLEYIKIIISNQLLHKDANIPTKDKIEVINKLLEYEDLKLKKEGYSGYSSLLDKLLAVLILHRRSRSIYYLYAMYKKSFGEKW